MTDREKPDWYPDPTGRFHLRYWSGQDWTSHVSDSSGNRSIDNGSLDVVRNASVGRADVTSQAGFARPRKMALILVMAIVVLAGVVAATVLTSADDEILSVADGTTTVEALRRVYTTTIAPSTTPPPETTARRTTTTIRRVTTTTQRQYSTSSAQRYGQNSYLDLLHDSCASGNNSACDDLYWDSAVGSDYEEFGRTCGGRRTSAAGNCSGSSDYGSIASDYEIALFTWSSLSYSEQQDICALWLYSDDYELINLLVATQVPYGVAVELVDLMWTVC